MMKKIGLLFLTLPVFFLLAFLGCSNDDDSNKEKGYWTTIPSGTERCFEAVVTKVEAADVYVRLTYAPEESFLGESIRHWANQDSIERTDDVTVAPVTFEVCFPKSSLPAYQFEEGMAISFKVKEFRYWQSSEFKPAEYRGETYYAVVTPCD